MLTIKEMTIKPVMPAEQNKKTLEKLPEKKPKIVIVMPAYNAALTLEKTYYAIPEGSYNQIILVDDASSDDTLEVATKLNITAIRHRKNRGYGGNQKTCYTMAMKEGADIIVMLHPDYQYDPSIAKDIVQPILRREADVVLASRMLGNPLKGGMPIYKYVANRFLTGLENIVLGTNFSEFHTGYRAYNRHALESVNFEANSENFVFDNEILVQFVIKKLRFKEIPVSTRYAFDSSSVSFKSGVIYGLSILVTITKYLLFKCRVIRFKQFN